MVDVNIHIAHIAIGLAILMIVATSFMIDLHALLIWPNLLILLSVRLRLQALSPGLHVHLRGLSLRLESMRSTFVSLKLPNQCPLRLLLNLVKSLLASHIHLLLRNLILAHLIIVEGIGSMLVLSLFLTYVLYVHDSPFNLISINKLTRDLNSPFLIIL